MPAPIALITGATGKQGSCTIDALLKSGKMQVRALTRNPDSAAAQALAQRGVQVVKGSLEDEESLVKALTGVYSAFLVAVPDFRGVTSIQPRLTLTAPAGRAPKPRSHKARHSSLRPSEPTCARSSSPPSKAPSA